jgi:lauroyl/myristoyl acyltransferase
MNLAKETLVQDIGRVVVWYPFRWLSNLLPLRTRFALYEQCGDAAFYSYRKKRAILGKRLSLAYPHLSPAQRLGTVRTIFRTYFVDRFLINLIPDLDSRRIDELADVDGEEYLREAQSLGRGVILIHPHYGPSQLPLIYLGYKGYPMGQLGLREYPETSAMGEKTQRLRLRLEHQMPVHHFYANDYLRPLFRWLEKGNILMTAGDGTGGGRRIGKFGNVTLLDRHLTLPLGAYRLAALQQSAMLTVIALRQKCGYYRIVIRPFATSQNCKEPQQQFADWLEPYLVQNPGQWHFWDEWRLESGSDKLSIKE